MKYRELAEAGVRWGPAGYRCRSRHTKVGLHKKLRRYEKKNLRRDIDV